MFVRGAMVALGLFCLCGTMFFIGVMVGRGTAPVHFDTRSFQEKLADLADNKDKKNPPEKMALGFYKELKKTMPPDFSLSDDVLAAAELVPSHGGDLLVVEDEPVDVEGPIPIKKGLKRMTRRAVPQNVIPGLEGTMPGRGAEVQGEVQGVPETSPELPAAFRSRGGYTIQISSFRQLADAIKRMETLKVKGFMPHRALALVNGKMWHRVRVGKFFDTLSAEKALKKLEVQGIYGIIVEIQ